MAGEGGAEGQRDGRSIEELVATIAGIHDRLSRMEEKLDARFVPREVYEARHTALRSEVALELAAIRAQQEADRKTAENGRAIAMWALGLIASAVVVTLVGFLATNGSAA